MKLDKHNIPLFLLLTVLFISGLGIGYVFSTSSSTFTISSGTYPSAYTYTVDKEDSTYYAKNAYGYIEYSGTNAKTIIQNVFNQNPQTVFFKEGIYDLNEQNVTAFTPIIICGEGYNSIIQDGTLKIIASSTWNFGTRISNMGFNSVGSTIQLQLINVTQSVITENNFVKTSYAVGVPMLQLTSCSSIKVEYNWFDGFNMQILRIDGTPLVQCAVDHIGYNDFGSTGIAFPSFTNPWDVTAIYIKGSINWGVTISENIAYLNNKNIFVYSEAMMTNIKNNIIGCGQNNYVIDLQGDHNEVTGNDISMPDDTKGAIAIRTTGNLEEVKYFNIISNNKISGANSEASIFGVLQRGIISNNYFNVYYGIRLHNSAYNLITSNFVQRLGSNANYGYNETGSSDYNVITACYFKLTYIFRGVGGNTRITACYNNTVWIQDEV